MSVTILQSGTVLSNATIAAGQTDEVSNNTDIYVFGTLDNLGTLFDDSTGNGTLIYFGSTAGTATATLEGGGVVLLSDNGNNYLLAPAGGDTLDNVDNLIEGSGDIGDNGANGGLAVINAAGGTIDATGTNAALTIQTGGPLVTNAGLLEATGPAGLLIESVVANLGGVILAAGAPVYLSGASIQGGTLASTGTGEIVAENGAVLDGTANTVTITAHSTVAVPNNTNMYVFGTLDNLGTLFDDSTGNGTLIYFGSTAGTATATLEGGGVVLLSDNGNNYLLAPAGGDTLDNVDNLIEGSGDIGDNGANGGLAVINAAGGTIDATGTNAALTIQTGGPLVTNAGLLEATGPAGLLIESVVANLGGVILAAGAPVYLSGATVQGGTLASTGTGEIVAENGAVLDGTANTVTITAHSTVAVPNNTNVLLRGTLDNAGTLFDDSTGNSTDIIIDSPIVTLDGGGVVLLSDNGNNRIYGANGTTDVLLNVNNTIEGAGQIGANSGGNPLALTNEAGGVIDATGTNDLVIQPGGPAVLNEGLIEASGTSTLSITNSATIANSGTGYLAARGPSAAVVLQNGADIQGGTLTASGGGAFFSSAATLDGVASAVTLAAQTVLQIDNNTALALLGSIDNAGTLFDDSTGNSTDIAIGSPIVTLGGGGVVLLSDNGNNRIYASNAINDILLNVNNTIEGAGQIGVNSGGNPLALTNEAGGVIDATGSNDLVIEPGGPALLNQGLIEATGTSTLNVTNGAVISNTGAGRILAAGTAAAVVLQGGAEIQGGTLAASGGGAFFTSAATLDGSASAVTLAAQTVLQIDNNSALTLFGSIDNAGTLSDDSTGNSTDIILSSPTVTLGGGGVVLLSDNGNNRIYGRSGSNDVLLNVNNTIEGAGQIGVNSGGNPLALTNEAGGVIDATGGNALSIQPGGPAVLNQGLIEATGTSTLSITNGATIANSGTGYLAAGGPSAAVVLQGGADIQGGTLVASGGGAFFDNNATLDGSTSPVTLAAHTVLEVENDSSLRLFGSIDTAGTLFDDSSGNSTDIVIGSPTVTLGGGGVVLLSDNGNNRIYGVSGSNDALLNAGDTIEGAGQLGIGSGGNPLALTNAAGGVIDADDATALTLQTGGPLMTNAGLLEATGGGQLSIVSTSVTNEATGTIGAYGGASAVFQTSAFAQNNNNGTLTGGTWASVDQGGATTTLALTGGAVTTDAADIVLSGTNAVFESYNNSAYKTLESSLTLVATGGTLQVLADRGFVDANDLGIATGGTVQLGGGTLSAPLIANAGSILGFGTITDPVNNGQIESTGSLVITSAVTGAGTLLIDNADTLELGAAASFSQTVVFGGIGTTLKLDAPTAFAGTLMDLVPGDTIDLPNNVATGTQIIAGGLLAITLQAGTTLEYALRAAATGDRPAIADGGNEVVIYREAVAGTTTPDSVQLGPVHVAGTISQALTISNTATNDGYSEDLDAGITAGGSITASGTVSGVAPQGSNSGGLSVGEVTTTDGVKSGAAVISFASDGTGVDGNPPLPIGTQTIDVTGTVFALAAPSVTPTPISFGTVRSTQTVAGETITVANGTTADAFQEKLGYSTAGSDGPFTLASNSGTVASGGSAALAVGFNHGTAGTFSNTATFALVSDTLATEGTLTDTALAAQTVALTGTVYATATASAPATLNFGPTHVNTAGTASLVIGNIATGTPADTLIASPVFVTAPAFTVQASPTIDVAAGGTGTLGYTLDSASTGTITGTTTLDYVSHDSVLSDLQLGTSTVNLIGTVFALAAPSVTATPINFGTVRTTQTVAQQTATVDNGTVPSAYQESLSYSTAGSDGPFTLANNSGTVLAGNAADLAVGFNNASAGTFSNTATFALVSDTLATEGTLTDTALAAQTVALSGTVYATATARAPATLNFGQVHANTGATAALVIGNIATGTPADTLIASVSATTPSAFTVQASPTIDVAAGSTGSLGYTLDSAALGTITGTTTLGYTSHDSVLSDLQLGTAAVSLAGTVFALASPSITGQTLDFVTRTTSGAVDQSATLANGPASAYQEGLGYAVGATPADFSVAANPSGTIASGGSASPEFAFADTTSGTTSGSVAVGLTSEPVAGETLAATVLTGETITLDGTAYGTAAPVLNATRLDFGEVHVGDPDPTVTLEVSNAAPGVLTDALTGGFSALPVNVGTVSTEGTLDVNAGGAGTLGLMLNTGSAGVLDAAGSLSLFSHDSQLADLAVAAGPVTLVGTVFNYATAVIEVNGSVVGAGGTADLGTVTLGTGLQTLDIDVFNTAAAGPTDLLEGGFSVSGGNPAFVGTPGTFSGLTNGESYVGQFVINTDTYGTETETITLDASSYEPDPSNTPLAPITFTVQTEVVCFATGTRIGTARGEVPVEDLRVGDRAVTASGALRTITWIGNRHLDAAFLAAHPDTRPVRVLAGAFGGGLPARSLLLSPGHPVLVGADDDCEGGALVPIMCLINGTSIARAKPDSVTYWHVELDRHDILRAEGLPAESFLDYGIRPWFEGADHALTDPDAVARGLAGRCRPVAIDGPLVEAERRRLDRLFALRLDADGRWPRAGAEERLAGGWFGIRIGLTPAASDVDSSAPPSVREARRRSTPAFGDVAWKTGSPRRHSAARDDGSMPHAAGMIPLA